MNILYVIGILLTMLGSFAVGKAVQGLEVNVILTALLGVILISVGYIVIGIKNVK